MDCDVFGIIRLAVTLARRDLDFVYSAVCKMFSLVTAEIKFSL